MVYLLLAGFVALVVALAWLSVRTGTAGHGCCAPAHPADDLRMRPVTGGDDRASG